jgi:hypothetical protein
LTTVKQSYNIMFATSALFSSCFGELESLTTATSAVFTVDSDNVNSYVACASHLLTPSSISVGKYGLTLTYDDLIPACVLTVATQAAITS